MLYVFERFSNKKWNQKTFAKHTYKKLSEPKRWVTVAKTKCRLISPKKKNIRAKSKIKTTPIMLSHEPSPPDTKMKSAASDALQTIIRMCTNTDTLASDADATALCCTGDIPEVSELAAVIKTCHEAMFAASESNVSSHLDTISAMCADPHVLKDEKMRDFCCGQKTDATPYHFQTDLVQKACNAVVYAPGKCVVPEIPSPAPAVPYHTHHHDPEPFHGSGLTPLPAATPSVPPSVSPSVSPSVPPSASPMHPSAHPSASPVHPSAHPLAHLSAHPSVHPSLTAHTKPSLIPTDGLAAYGY